MSLQSIQDCHWHFDFEHKKLGHFRGHSYSLGTLPDTFSSKNQNRGNQTLVLLLSMHFNARVLARV